MMTIRLSDLVMEKLSNIDSIQKFLKCNNEAKEFSN
jgi:hypothetical protein